MVFSERVLSLTQNYLLPKVVDNVLHSNVLAFRIMGNGKQGKGESIKRPIKYQNTNTAISFAGLDTFTANLPVTKIRMSYDMRAVRIPVAIAGMEWAANAVSETQITNMVKEALEEGQMELIDYTGTLLYGLGTGNNSKDLLGLGAIVDDGTDVTTLGTLSRTTYPVLQATRTASGGTLSLSLMATLYTAISDGSSLSTPTLGISTPSIWDLYEQLLTPMVRESFTQMGYYKVGMQKNVVERGSNEGLSGTQGFVALSYKGIPLVRDSKATAQNLFFLNEEWLDFYGWDAAGADDYKKVSLGASTVEGLYAEAPMSEYNGFNWSGFRNPYNQFGAVADIIILGNLTSWQPRRHGRLTGITTV